MPRAVPREGDCLLAGGVDKETRGKEAETAPRGSNDVQLQ